MDRFWEKVDKTLNPPCWEWIASKHHRSGYGHFKSGRKTVAAHIFAYELTNGPVPKGLELHHTCENPSCVNPSHLKPVTRKQHTALDRSGKSHWLGKRTHCETCNLPLSGENLILRKGGWRGCRNCQRTRQREYMRRYRQKGSV